MAIDVYSPCPGGTGKKIKFCCPDFLGELDKISRMVEGEQYQACLDLVRRLLEKWPTRACLMGTECLLARMTDQLEEAEAAAGRFLTAHPENPLAWAETAILAAVTEGGRPAMRPLQDALKHSGREISGRVYEMLWTVGQILAMDGECFAAQAVLSLQAYALRDDVRPVQLLTQVRGSRAIPIWVREPARMKEPPADAPWKSEHEAAIALSRLGRWSESADQLLALATKAGDPAGTWYNAGIMRAWAGEDEAAALAFRKYASLGVPLEDAVEAEALAIYLSEDPLGDEVDRVRLEYEVEDAERLQVGLSSSRYLEGMAAGAMRAEDDEGPPPKAAYLVGNRERGLPAESTPAESLARVLGLVRLYGRETDRPARLEVLGVTVRDLPQLKSVLGAAAGPLLGAPSKEEPTERVSATRSLLSPHWLLPKGANPQQYQQLLLDDEQDAMANRWPQLPLGVLDGKTPQEAAGDPALRTRLLAAILLVEAWADAAFSPLDFNGLRSRLGLPTLEPIDPEGLKAEDVPATRLVRLVVEKLSDDALLRCYHRVVGLNAMAAVTKFARAIVERASFEKRPERLRAFASLARAAEDSEQALTYVDEGRKAAEAAGESSARWDMMELSVRFRRGEGDAALRLLRHLDSQHGREPGVAEAIQQMLVEFGVLRPDGTPAQMAQQRAEEPAPVTPGEAAEPGKLWLPDGQRPAGEKPRIWTPGME